ncbi:glycosylphosphatidylinositol anchor attachment 1 protein [Contarinia nasturtii]|uniref:glycosylphosphatidylinositol anchor attachment 1 protein n=1 Tax=Contarinia nasturtii TaxID=265458 RepID=UPI0012D4A696|nr:glycosylphosphatidylinositol anchor attachment 1 protein [Contarinia nasturtii]
MKLLTGSHQSPNKRKFQKYLIKFKTSICVLLYIAGIVYFCSLAHPSRNNATYFSENALLPGLVNSEMRMEHTHFAVKLYDDLEREREKHKNTIPTAWILAKFRQIGLEAYVHNFTLNYPLGGGRSFSGKNVYGILRAPRIGSTEAIVISAAYRTPESIHPVVMASVPVLMSFANFARRQKYWAKDIIFLVTDQEQLGMQAWLEAYHNSDVLDSSSILNCGNLEARAGSIQAAINLELQSFDLNYIDVKIEGLNGQLPNLDLVNLVQRIAAKEGFISGHRQSSNIKRSGAKSTWEENFQHMMSMVLTKSTGVANGNHGLFYRYAIEAVTLEGHAREQTNYQRRSNGATSILRLIEGITRSVNNLLERFHQSFFFYLLVASDRFVSIGDYMPSLGLLVSALLIKAFITWLNINQKSIVVDNEERNEDEDKSILDKDDTDPNENDLKFISVAKFLIIAHIFGVLAAYLPFIGSLDSAFHQYGIKTEVHLFFTLLVLSLVSLTVPQFFSFSVNNIELLHVAILLEASTALIIVGMLNFSLGFLLSAFFVPFALFINPKSGLLRRRLSQFMCLFMNPLMAVYLIVFMLTWWSFGELSIIALAKRAFTATLDAITFSIVDSIIYSNWLYPLVSLILFPIWITYFGIVSIKQQSDHSKEKKLN